MQVLHKWMLSHYGDHTLSTKVKNGIAVSCNSDLDYVACYRGMIYLECNGAYLDDSIEWQVMDGYISSPLAVLMPVYMEWDLAAHPEIVFFGYFGRSRGRVILKELLIQYGLCPKSGQYK